MSENHVDLVINGDIAMEEMPAHVEYVQGMENPTEDIAILSGGW